MPHSGANAPPVKQLKKTAEAHRMIRLSLKQASGLHVNNNNNDDTTIYKAP